jgi:hypothetical protein
MKKRIRKKKYYTTCDECKFKMHELERASFSIVEWCEKTDNDIEEIMMSKIQKCKSFKRDPEPKKEGFDIYFDEISF